MNTSTTLHCSACMAPLGHGSQACPQCRLPLTARAIAIEKEPLFSTTQIVVILLGILVIVCCVCTALQNKKDSAIAAQNAKNVLAEYQSGKLDDPMTFQTHCGGADSRIDRPAYDDLPAHAGLNYKAAGLSVLFVRHQFQSAKAEAKRPNPFAAFEEPTFWQTTTVRMINPEAALGALGCKP